MRGRLSAAAVLATVLLTGAAVADGGPVLARAGGLQPPAWMEREGSRQAVISGAPLYAGDRFETGKGGRLQIELQDDGIVKLGENARFEMPSLTVKNDGSAKGLLQASLRVLRGAFRYTTSELSKLRPREIDVSIGPTITAGIRGTDIWGKSDDSQELLCLLEGRIEVASPGHPSQIMDQSLSFYVVPHDQAPLPVAPAPMEKVATWAPQTEMDPAKPALTAAGPWRVALYSALRQSAAEAHARELSAQGYPAAVASGERNGRTYYRVVIEGLANRKEALRYAASLKSELGIAEAWVMLP